MWYTLLTAKMEGAESDEADFNNPMYWNLTEDIDTCDQLLTATYNVTLRRIYGNILFCPKTHFVGILCQT